MNKQVYDPAFDPLSEWGLESNGTCLPEFADLDAPGREASQRECEMIALATVVKCTYNILHHALTEELFEDQVHKDIFRVLKSLREKGMSVGVDNQAIELEWDVVFPNNCTEDHAFSDDKSTTISTHIFDICTRSHLGGHPKIGDILRNNLMRRVIVSSAARMATFASKGGEPDIALSRFYTDIAAVRALSRDTVRSSVREIGREMIADWRSGNQPDLIHSGSNNLDDYVGGGYERGWLVYLGARPSVGKSMVALSLAIGAAKKGHTVLFFTMEMSKKEVMRRMLSNVSNGKDNAVPYVETKSLDAFADVKKIDRLETSYGEIEDLDFEIIDRRGLTVSEIDEQISLYAQHLTAKGKTLDMVVVDYIGLVSASSNYKGNRANEVGEISNGLMLLANKHQVAMVALSQLNREVEKKEDGKPRLDHLRESGNLEQDAHVVIMLHREDRAEAQKPQAEQRMAVLHARRIQFLILKNRGGRVGEMEQYCEPAYSDISDLAA